MERICGYCKKPYLPKRADALYCSHSCRQLAYVLRKASDKAGKEVFRMANPNPIGLNEADHEKKPSIESETLKHYPSIENNEIIRQLNELTFKTEETHELENDAIKLGSEITVKTDQTKNDRQKPEPIVSYTEHKSAFLKEISDVIEDRDYQYTLHGLLSRQIGNPESWVSIRYKCIIECLLTLSEMKNTEVDDLKEVCNALTLLIQSNNFKYLVESYPYKLDILQLNAGIYCICLNADTGKVDSVKFRLKKETRINLLATRWELAQFVPKVSFSKLNFTE